MKRVLYNLLFVLVAMSVISAQQAQPAKPATPVAKPAPKPVVKAPVKLTSANPNNQELIDLAQGGARETILLGAVADAKREGRPYDKSAKEVLTLTRAGVTDAVIEAIRGASGQSPASAPVAPPTVVVQTPAHVGVSLDAPSTVSLDGREAGIYLSVGKDLEQLEPSVYSGGKSGNKLWARVPFVGTDSLKAVVRSAAANQRVQTSVPTFYFFFEVKGAGLSNTGGTFAGYMNSASSPNEFVLMKMNVSTDEREVIVAKSSIMSDRTGVQSKDTVDFASKKQRSGVYEVKPRKPLPPGEYCFFYAAGSADKGGNGKLFDFGVDPGATVQQ